MKTNIKLISLFAIFVAIDQFAKKIFTTSVCNKNIAWDVPISPAIFYFVWLLIIAILIRLFLTTKSHRQKFFLILIFSGAVSNLIDRIRFACVVDYIDLGIWPVFNLADIYITAGVILIISTSLRNRIIK